LFSWERLVNDLSGSNGLQTKGGVPARKSGC
jgi:hypothetical protein